jgi:hypothetical protein
MYIYATLNDKKDILSLIFFFYELREIPEKKLVKRTRWWLDDTF